MSEKKKSSINMKILLTLVIIILNSITLGVLISSKAKKSSQKKKL